MIENVICWLYKLCFDAEKLVIWIVQIMIFLDKKLIIEEIVSK